MLVRRLLVFIDSLKTLKNLVSGDIIFINDCVNHFQHHSADEPLDDEDIQFLVNCFEKRWEKIIVDSNDYMLNPGLANQNWIELAIDLAPLTTKNYLQILIPSITNSIDFNNLSALTETVRLENFYLGQGNTTLYRKRGLCEHLIGKTLFYLLAESYIQVI